MLLKISRVKFGLIIISALLVCFFMLGALFFRNSTYEKLAIMTEVLHLVKNNYVDKVDLKKLYKGAFKGLMEALDAESAYLNKEEYKYFQISAPNKYGIALARRTPESLIVISRVTPSSSAYNAGIRSRLLIKSINGHHTSELSLFQARYLLAVEKKNLRLFLTKEKTDKEIYVELRPGKPIWERAQFKLMEGNIGYINIPNLLSDTSKQVRHAITYLKNAKAEALIIDLRDNCQGLNSEAIKVADFFLEKGYIASLEPRRGEHKIYQAIQENTIYKSLLAILVNSQTIGASEILANAIKDNNRGKILGEQTFGLGLEYRFVPLPSGEALWLPWARYYTAKGEEIQ